MSDTTFVDNVTTAANRIVAAWLNVVNNAIFRGQHLWYCNAAGTANALSLTPVPAVTAMYTGQIFRFKATANNTGATTQRLLELQEHLQCRKREALLSTETLSARGFTNYSTTVQPFN